MAPVGGLTIGVSGSEADMWIGRVKEMALYNPENIVIHIGVNDINRGFDDEEYIRIASQYKNILRCDL